MQTDILNQFLKYQLRQVFLIFLAILLCINQLSLYHLKASLRDDKYINLLFIDINVIVDAHTIFTNEIIKTFNKYECFFMFLNDTVVLIF